MEAGAVTRRGGCAISPSTIDLLSSSGSVRGESSSRSVRDDRGDRGRSEGEELIDEESMGERSTDEKDSVRDDKVETDKLLIHLPV